MKKSRFTHVVVNTERLTPKMAAEKLKSVRDQLKKSKFSKKRDSEVIVTDHTVSFLFF